VYYARDLRVRIFEWKTAGAIADAIPRQIKGRYPDLPDGAMLVLGGIPRMVGHAYVYPLCLEDSIGRFYPNINLKVLYGNGSPGDAIAGRSVDDRNTFYFQYMPDQGGVDVPGDMQK
jgi:hypothetical protein